MSNNQNEIQNTGGTLKPTIQKTNLRLHRPQTTGYQQEEVPEANILTQSKPTPPPTAKPSLNISASVYIPKSISSSVSSGNVASVLNQDKNIQSTNPPISNVQSNMLNTNTQAFTPKMSNAYTANMNMNAQINPMAQNYNMGQMNPTYPTMYNMPNMGMMNSNSMMNYTYLSSNYQNYQQQQGYNAYMPTNPTNKFSSSQFYSPQTPNPNQMYSNVYQNKISNQMPMNVPSQTMPMATPPMMNNIVQNTNISAHASPSVSTLSHTSLPLQKEANLSSVSTSSATSHIKKPINLEAQSFIPKNLKKPSISSEKDLQGLTPKKETIEVQVEPIQQTPEKEIKPSDKTEIITNENISERELPSPIVVIQKEKTPETKKIEENERELPIKEEENKQSPDNFSLDKKGVIVPPEEKPSTPTDTNIIPEATKQKPKTLLGSILSQPPSTIAQTKPAEKTIINPVPVAAPAKKKQTDVSKALEEKAKDLKEQEKLKKEEKLREEIKQKQASATSTPTSTRKSGKDVSKKAQRKQEKLEEAEEKPIEKEKENKAEIEKIEEEKLKLIEENKEKEEKEKQELIKPEEKAERKFKIERIYFRVHEDEKAEDIKNRYAYEYLFSYRNWKISYETKLVEELMTGHFKALKETVEEVSTSRQQNRGVNESKGGFGKRGTKFRDEPVQPKISNENVMFQRSKIEFKQPETKDSPSTETGEGLGKWGRKDLSKEEKLASEFKSKREEQIKKDPIRFKLTEHLNTITIDNFAETKQSIMDMINLSQENQEKFIEVLFKKAVTEKSYVVIYARLCKEVDRELTPKEESLKSSINVKKPPAKTSTFRTKLLEKCKNVFKNEDQEELSLYVNIKDPEEKQQRQKAFLLGNVNFIAEMIINKILSKKVVNQCINNLFGRVEKLEKENDFMKHVCLEGIVILTDKFGTLVNRQDTKIKAEDQQKFNEDIDGYLNRLNDIQENDKTLPGHIRFKIINLIEKKYKNWEESIVESNRKIKGRDEVREEHEMEQRGGIQLKTTKGSAKLDQDSINMKIKDEMSNWKEYKKLGKNRNFDWSITESILGNKLNNIGEILSAFGENCIDFIGKPEDIDIAYTYLYEILDFYHKNIGERDKREIKNTTIFFLTNLSDLILDNGLLIDIWGSVLHAFLEFEIFGYKDLDELKDLQEDQLKTVFEVVAKSLEYYDEEKKKQIFKSLQEINIFKNNSSLFSTYASTD